MLPVHGPESDTHRCVPETGSIATMSTWRWKLSHRTRLPVAMTLPLRMTVKTPDLNAPPQQRWDTARKGRGFRFRLRSAVEVGSPHRVLHSSCHQARGERDDDIARRGLGEHRENARQQCLRGDHRREDGDHEQYMSATVRS